MKRHRRLRITLALKLLVLLLCALNLLTSHYPPVQAQVTQIPPSAEIAMPQQFAVSPYDPEFRADIDAINRHLSSNDARIDAMRDTASATNRELSNMEGEQHVYFWIIGGLLTGSIVLPELRKRKKEENG
jgi:hypothetical protein